ncbi:hypothetical protein Kirov_160 [Bacillus phage Kirov]|uniref:Uncharacterized protein n=1 Tax=Bacillus phage Kirov TaxID=2783539 RepID=A0A7U3NJX4_9CAUD|nr:hypothetical protein PQE67_gp144 [Bacillus phage Kirov]QOV08359.1 hypothetical protein Kirov_160 [Bacillus phage Kirov]
MRIFGKNSTITIGSQTYVGNNIVVTKDGKVIVDGVEQDTMHKEPIQLTVNCNVECIVAEEDIRVHGAIHGNVEAKNSINCDRIDGNAKAGNAINCDDIKGNAEANVINCDDIHGSATAKIINR